MQTFPSLNRNNSTGQCHWKTELQCGKYICKYGHLHSTFLTWPQRKNNYSSTKWWSCFLSIWLWESYGLWPPCFLSMSPLILSRRFLLAREHCVLAKVGNGRFSLLSENIVLTALWLLKAAGLFTWAGAQLWGGGESWSHHHSCLATGVCHAAEF